MKYLIVVDMQNDFIDGALGTKEAIAIVPDVKKFIESFKGEIIFTRDTHTEDYLNTQEGKKLPVTHCVKNTCGWEICPELKEFAQGKKIFDKPTFGSVALADYIISKNDAEEITLLGLCTDICVISNAILLKAKMPEISIKVAKNCCAGVSVDSHNRALEAMKMCHIEII